MLHCISAPGPGFNTTILRGRCLGTAALICDRRFILIDISDTVPVIYMLQAAGDTQLGPYIRLLNPAQVASIPPTTWQGSQGLGFRALGFRVGVCRFPNTTATRPC